MYDALSGEYTMTTFLMGIILGLLYVFGFMVYQRIKENKNDKNS